MRRINRSGFTLVEAMIVMVIAGVLLAIALPRFSAIRQGAQIDGAAQQLAGDLRRAQIEAIRWNRSIQFVRTGASTYTIDTIGARSFDAPIVFASSSAASVRMAAFGPPVGLVGATFTLELAERRKTVIVSPAGFVRVQ